MKKIVYIFYFLGIISCKFGISQDVLIKTNGDTLHIKVIKLGSENISFRYPREDMIYELPKGDFIKAIYGSGREDVFNKGSALKLEKKNLIYKDSIILTVGFRYIGAVHKINLDGVEFILKGSHHVLQIPYPNINKVWYNSKYYHYNQLIDISEQTHFVKKINPELVNLKSYKVSVDNSSLDGLTIEEIRFEESSTFVYFTYRNEELIEKRICVDENIYIQGKVGRKYMLISSINLPFCNKKAILKSNEELRFILEFEKMPYSINEFSIIDKSVNNYNVTGVHVNYEKKIKLDMAKFVNNTPVKEFGSFYRDANPVQYYKYDGLFISVMTNLKISSGKYYCVYILIDNFTGKEILFDPDRIDVEITDYKLRKVNGNLLSYDTYIKIVKNQQKAEKFLLAFSEIVAAYNAGYSSSSSVTSKSSAAFVSGSASSYSGGVYSTASGSGVAFKKSISVSHTKSYDGSAAYFANQRARENINQKISDDFEIRKSISEGYLKKTTIFNAERYYGYFNIVYIEGENMKLEMLLGGKVYVFNMKIY